MSGEDVMRRVREIHRAELKKSRAARPGVGTPGETEIRDPLGSNRVKYNIWFYGHRVRGDNFMWCAVYQAFVFATAKISTDIYPKAAVPDVRDFFKARGQLFPTPMAGDLMIIIHDAKHRHIGFVEELCLAARQHLVRRGSNQDQGDQTAGALGSPHRTTPRLGVIDPHARRRCRVEGDGTSADGVITCPRGRRRGSSTTRTARSGGTPRASPPMPPGGRAR
jgi:hypothetical protein